MKKIILILSTFTALLLASCASPAGSSDDPTGTGTNTNETGGSTGGVTATKYTLSFNANYPFDDTVTFNNGEAVYASAFSEKGNKYWFEKVTVPEQTSVTASSYTLSASPYKYVKNVETDGSYRTCQTYNFSYYNTKANGTGTSYSAGQTIYLTQDTTLYVFYSPESDSNVDISNVHTYNLKVGESVTFSQYYNDNIELYIDVNLGNFDSSIVDVNNMTVTAKAPGSTTVTAKAFNQSEQNKTPSSLQCLINVTSDNFSGQGIEYKLLGTWKTGSNGDNYSGTITFNSNKTGSIRTTLNGTTTHDTTFNWSAAESGSGSQKTYTFTITNANDNLNGSHGIYELRSNRFSMNEWLAFGMPQYTTWYKQ